ncbi:Replication factor A protein 1 [Modicella reniformis]|uniref:Replication protein A subunit n=1 Tax=Modicella reniformis TaxID=1440133 RepID=A0A9P6IN08_9FUNG|nr:Replication factor A protein 1 [Modicella reniformis]
MTNPCTPNAIQAIYNGQPCETPVLQVVNIKAMPQQTNGPTRFRQVVALIWWQRTVNENLNHTTLVGILGTNMNNLVESGAMKVFTIVRLNKYSLKPINGKKLIIVMELNILDSFGDIGKVGRPTSIDPEFQTKAGAGVGLGQQPQSFNAYQNKSDIKTWSKPGANEGRLFSMVFMDESSEIKATAFTQQVDEFYNIIEEGKVYFISGARVDLAKKQFSNVKNDYELILQRDTQIIHAPDNNHVPAMRYKFVELRDLSDVNEKDTVDVIAIVKEVGEVTNNISQKTNRPVIKRDLTLVDSTGFTTRLTLWGNQAESFSISGSNPVIAFKSVSVSNYNGKSLNGFGGSSFRLNPEITEAFRLRAWFDQQGLSATFQAHASEFNKGGAVERLTFDEFKSRSANLDPTQSLHFETRGTIIMMSKTENTFQYPACPTSNCNKKVTRDNNGWRCEKCNQTHAEPEYRYIMGVNAADHTGQNWLQAFNDAGQIITGRPAVDLVMNSHEVKPTFDRATFKSYIFKCRAKQETYGDEAKTRFTIVAATPLNWIDESKYLLKKLEEYKI